MVGLPDEDGPTMSSAEVKAVVRAETEASPPEEADAEDGPTVQATVSPEIVAATPRPGPPRPGPPRPDSKPKLEPPPPAQPPAPAAASQEEEEQDSITATAPRVDPSKLPVSVPKIPLTPIEGEEELETEVKTMTGAEGAALVTALAAAEPAPAAVAVPPPPEEDDDPATMTAQAPAPTGAVPETTASPLGDDDDDDGATVNTAAPTASTGSSPAMRVRISSKSLMEPSTLTGTGDAPTKPGVDKHEAPTKSGVGAAPEKEYEPEDSITSRALAKVDDADEYEDDSVTTQALAPAVGAAAGLIPPTGRSDDTDATTQKKAKAPASPADEEQESITTQAPGHLTNMLRVIASDAARRSSPGVPPPFEDDEPPENKTAVMPNAPVKGAPGGGPIMKHGTLQGMGPVSPPSSRPPAISPIGAHVSLAPRLDPGSESGLRVAHDAASGEHASLGVILGAKERMSSGRVGLDSESRLPHAATEPVFPPLAGPDDVAMPRPPRYGLLVTVVAAISIIVPVSLYVFLNRGDDTITPGVPAQPSADVVKRDDPLRQKYVKPASTRKHR